MKKVFAFVLALVLVASLAVTAFAASSPTSTGSYAIIAGANAQIALSGNSDQVFSSDADFAKFMYVKVDNVQIDASNYTVESGSTKVTLKAAYLKTLAVGTHSLTIVSNDGEATTYFTILGDGQGTGDYSGSPATGSTLFVVLGSACILLASAAFVAKKRIAE